MSFLDLATLALHRRTEMEARINIFLTKSDHAIENIKKLKVYAQRLVNQLNCEPDELREHFLNGMQQLDEFIYLITDFNLSVGKLEETGNIDSVPVHDTSRILYPIPTNEPTFNIMDVLSEPTPSTSTACSNKCPLDTPARKRIPKSEQTLIVFSSSSSSYESVPIYKAEAVEKKEQEIQCDMVNAIENIKISDHNKTTDDAKKHPDLSDTASPSPVESYNLPGHTMLQTDIVYPATIVHLDGGAFWVISDDPDELFTLMAEMTEYYQTHSAVLTLEQVTSLTYCAAYEADLDSYFRGLFIKLDEDDIKIAEVYLVDTGEMRRGPRERLQHLAPQFCEKPPYARCCHLAGVDLLGGNKELMDKQEAFMQRYVGTPCAIKVDDNTSESLGVYVIVKDNETLNDLMVKEGLATLVDAPADAPAALPAWSGPPELSEADLSSIDLDSNCPEYDNPVEAVTGYDCRDEADICKHYKGGPEKTCFKGARCTKKHVVIHPDGWTLDRVEVMSCEKLPLPTPGTWHKVLVTYVCHYNRLYVQLVTEDTKRPFGAVLPPMSLDALVMEMNSPATRMTYKPLKMAPAPFELVAAQYPLDGQWYRAQVVSTTRIDQNVEVRFVDYGNVMWVKDDAIRALDPRHAVLPAQALRVLLAGVCPRTPDSRQWAATKAQLASLTLDRTFRAHVIARDYDEVSVELFDADGYSIAEKLAALGMVTLEEYVVVDDTKVTHKHVVP